VDQQQVRDAWSTLPLPSPVDSALFAFFSVPEDDETTFFLPHYWPCECFDKRFDFLDFESGVQVLSFPPPNDFSVWKTSFCSIFKPRRDQSEIYGFSIPILSGLLGADFFFFLFFKIFDLPAVSLSPWISTRPPPNGR